VVTPPAEIGQGVSFAIVADPAGGAFALLGPMEG
jgi:predicted enzyme related to lactoylglutathione lyase